MNSWEKFRLCIRIIRAYLEFHYHDISERKSMYSFGKIVWIIFGLTMFSGMIHTVLFYNKAASMYALITSIGMFQIVTKLLLISDFLYLIEIVEFMFDIYDKNQRKREKYYELCKRFANISLILLILALSLYCFLVVFEGVFTFIQFSLTGEFIPPYSVSFPNTNDQIFANIYGIILINITAMIFFVTISLGVDSLIVLVIANIPFISTILIRELEEFKSTIEKSKLTEEQIKFEFLRIIFMHRKYNE